MTDYWDARAEFIREWVGRTQKFVDLEDMWWNTAIYAARRWADNHAELGARMNLSLLPPGRKFEITRSLPFDSKLLRNRKRTDETGKVVLDGR